jgi:biopolymer transport protein ExbB
MIYSLAIHFKEGGWGMWPLVFLFSLTLALFFERAWVVFGETTDHVRFMYGIRALLFSGAHHQAMMLCSRRDSALSSTLFSALSYNESNETAVDARLQEAMLHMRPRIERRSEYFKALANISAATGLLGTITGFIGPAYCPHGEGWPTIDPARKAECLAGSIAEALNCTAGGLAVAVLALCCYAVINGRTQRVLDELDGAAASIAHALMIVRANSRKPHPFRSVPQEE